MGTCQWTRGRAIGRGSSATVSMATDSRSGAIFAVKSAELIRSSFLQREQVILSRLDCPRVVAYMGHDVTAENGLLFYNLFMEYVDGGTLSDAIRRHGGRLSEPAIRSHTRSILEGLVYLHSERLVHCDIKGRNVLMGQEGAKIADLGCARWADGIEKGPIAGTPLFMAPEVARCEEQGFPADVWALGCTLIEMATGCAPWPDMADPVSALYRIGYSAEVPEFPSWLSDEGKDFLSKCLRRCPTERWTANQLLKHPFVDELNSPPKQILASALSNSPKSTLDQSFWDSLDDIRPQQELTHMESIDDPLAGRLQQLSSGNSPSGTPDWTWGESWVTVRSSDGGEVSPSQPQEGQIPAGQQTSGSDVWRSHEIQELSTNLVIEETALSIRVPNTLHSCNGVCVIGCTCTIDVTFSIVNLAKPNHLCFGELRFGISLFSIVFVLLSPEIFVWNYTQIMIGADLVWGTAENGNPIRWAIGFPPFGPKLIVN
ncbi:mitogen-activated protein kinase kinase kinase 18-like [Magnolia sinica]|uniref:mitogen-activated protein kinase kinase kinase 18-like n=1 Tax=Magnolia sinica TaxID=86752 RepID=UPI002658BFDC|nr:mitogen-activated protein kinase kinase kinase 18-like [Magnolia sinica]